MHVQARDAPASVSFAERLDDAVSLRLRFVGWVTQDETTPFSRRNKRYPSGETIILNDTPPLLGRRRVAQHHVLLQRARFCRMQLGKHKAVGRALMHSQQSWRTRILCEILRFARPVHGSHTLEIIQTSARDRLAVCPCHLHKPCELCDAAQMLRTAARLVRSECEQAARRVRVCEVTAVSQCAKSTETGSARFGGLYTQHEHRCVLALHGA